MFSLSKGIPWGIIGFLLGIIGMYFYERNFENLIYLSTKVILVLFIILVICFILLFGLKNSIIKYLYGKKYLNNEASIDELQQFQNDLTNQLVDRLLINIPFESRERIKYFTPKILNLFVWARFRNWWWSWILGLIVSLGGLLGTILLIKQNELLGTQNILLNTQNNKLDEQIILSKQQIGLEDANRRSSLIVLMSNIIDKIDNEIRVPSNSIRGTKKTRKFSLSQSLIGQIAALSHSFKEYYFLEGKDYIESPLSPERGYLLRTLWHLPLSDSTMYNILNTSDFDYAELKKLRLLNSYLKSINLNYSNLDGALIQLSNMQGARLFHASLKFANFEEVNLSWGHLQYSSFVGSSLYKSNLSNADLSNADLTNVKLTSTNLTNANLYKANLTNTTLKNAILENVNFQFTNVGIEQLSTCRSLLNCKNLHDTLKIPLQKDFPHLFKKYTY